MRSNSIGGGVAMGGLDGRIRVCFIATGADLGGAPRSLLEMIQGLLETGYVEPYVILRRGGALEEALDEIGVAHQLVRFPSSVRSKRYPDWVKSLAERLAERRLFSIIRRGGFDIVHNNSILYGAGIRAAHFAGVPCVCHVREFARHENGLDFLNEKRQRDTMSMNSHIIFISHAVAERFADWAPGVERSVLYNGFDINRYARDHGSVFAHAPYKLLLAGHIMPTKGQLDAVNAVCVLQKRGLDVRLCIVGLVQDEAYHRELLRLIDRENAAGFVEIHDFVNDLGELRSQSDACLICSTANEGLGRVTIEGMLAGCLAIGPRMGATAEVMQDGRAGLLYDARSARSLAECVAYAIDHPDEMNRIARSANEWAREAFDATAYGKSILSVYRCVLDGCDFDGDPCGMTNCKESACEP